MPDEDYGQFIKQVWETAAHPFNVLWDWAKEPDTPERRAARWTALADWARRHAKAERHSNDPDSVKDWQKRRRIYVQRAKRNMEPEHSEDVPGIIDGGWHPEARRVGVVAGIGPLQHPVGGALHTTEGYGVPVYAGSNPHFTLDVSSGPLYQHQDVRQGARALQNLAGGVETNRKVIQIECIAFAARAGAWTEEAYDNLADLMRWIEEHCGVERKFALPLAPYPGHPQKFTSSGWNSYGGWCGHQNVPENDHGDPGALSIPKLLA